MYYNRLNMTQTQNIISLYNQQMNEWYHNLLLANLNKTTENTSPESNNNTTLQSQSNKNTPKIGSSGKGDDEHVLIDDEDKFSSGDENNLSTQDFAENGEVGERKGNNTKKIKREILCEHTEESHYAKNLCLACYHKYGRSTKPWKCDHEVMYAKGLCKLCYLNHYYKNKKRAWTRKRKAIIKGRKAHQAKLMKKKDEIKLEVIDDDES